MASSAIPSNSGDAVSRARSQPKPLTTWQIICLILKPFASLKVTVGLFVALVFITFVGTLGQSEETMQDALNRYFHSAFVWIEFKTFFPECRMVRHLNSGKSLLRRSRPSGRPKTPMR